MKKIPLFQALLLILFLLCTGGTAAEETPSFFSADDIFSKRDFRTEYKEEKAVSILLQGNSASCMDPSVRISGSTVTITKKGVYVLSGALENGTIIIDAEKSDKVQLVLKGVSIHHNTFAPLYILQADKVFITLAEGTENTLSNGGKFTSRDGNNVDGVIFSKEDLCLNGLGALSISSPAGHGVVSKDDLAVTGGNYQISASGHALSGKDSLCIAGGNFQLDAGKDTLHAEHDEDAEKGFLYISDGSFLLSAQGDAVSASGKMQLDGGSFTLKTGNGPKETTRQDSFRGWQMYSVPQADSPSRKALKASGEMILRGGEFMIQAEDDALHSNSDLYITGGNFTIATGDDGLHADSALSVSGGNIRISQSYEGLEGQRIEISGGLIDLTASDDGLNAAGGKDQSGISSPWGRDMFAVEENSYISISGGKIMIDAAGDGIDSNGHFYVSGGETYVSGPTGNGNGALDFNGNAVITGGSFLAAGSSGMAQSFSADSTQGVMLVSLNPSISMAPMKLTDNAGKEIFSWQSKKQFTFMVLSSPEIRQNETYTLSMGNESAPVTMEKLVYTLNQQQPGGPGRPGGPGGRPGRP